MATTITKTVGSGGGRDYATIAAFWAAVPSNLVTADEQWIAELYNDSTFNETLTFSGKTTDATRNIIIRCAAGQSFKHNASKLTNALRYNASNGVSLTNTSPTITITGAMHLEINGLQIDSAAAASIEQTNSGPNVRIVDCILQSAYASTDKGPLVLFDGRAINVLAVNTGGGTGCLSNGGSANFHNVTSIQMGSAGAFGFRGNYDTPVCTNCVAFGFGTNYRAGVTGNYNASGQASPPGANSVGSLTFADQFQNVASTGTMDFRLKSGHGMGVGTRDQTYTNDLDILGQARSTTTPAIGVVEPITADTTPPNITGPSGSAGDPTSSKSMAEGTTAVHTFTADETVTWDLNGGADVARFTINSSTGALSFLVAPNFEVPTDDGTNNTYVVGVRATDVATNAATQTVTVTITNANEAPTFTGTISIPTLTEGVAMSSYATAGFFADVDAGDTAAYSAIGSWPAGVTVNSSTGVISGTPTTAGTYASLQVRRTDSGALTADSNTFTITVLPTSPTAGTTTSITSGGATLNWTNTAGGSPTTRVQLETPSGAGNWTDATGATNPAAAGVTSFAATGLAASTQYRPRFAHISGGQTSAYTVGTEFTTSAAGATGVTLGGPSGGVVGVASTNFTVGVTPEGGTITGTLVVTPNDNSGGGTFTPTSVNLTTGSPTATFTYTPASSGAKTIGVTNNGGLTNPSTITYTASGAAATQVTIDGPTTGVAGSPSSNFTVGANGVISGTVTVTPSATGCTFTPSSVNISAGSPTATFTCTAATAGAKSITLANNGSLTNPAAWTYTASSAAATTASFLITTDGTTPAANLSGLKFAFFDEATPDLWTAPKLKAANGATNGSGIMTLNITGVTGLAVGQVGSVVATNSDGSTSQGSSLRFTFKCVAVS